jgi:2-oxoisovalerate dehydrogenase E2 component (dihydrolipoyl transacylase)
MKPSIYAVLLLPRRALRRQRAGMFNPPPFGLRPNGRPGLAPPSRAPLHSSAALPRQFKLTDIGEGITEVELLKWHVQPGATVQEFDKLCEVQSDKAAVEITSRFAGVIKALGVKEGDMIKVGSVLVEFATEAEAAAPLQSSPQPVPAPLPPPAATPLPAGTSSKGLASPAVRHLARQSQLDLGQIPGSGRDGRVLKEDILKYLTSAETALDGIDAAARPAAAAAAAATSGESTMKSSPPLSYTVPIRGIRREMAKQMTASLSIPHLSLMEQVRVDAALAALSKRASLLALLVKACSVALCEHPELNATHDAERGELVVHNRHNISIAMDTPKGLLTPVLFDVQNLSVMDISARLEQMKSAAGKGAFAASDFKGGTFALSNIGSLGGTYATPVIIPGQVAIGAFGRARREPRFLDDGATPDVVVACRVLSVSWSADHRVIDGAAVARFSNSFVRIVENPYLLALGLR